MDKETRKKIDEIMSGMSCPRSFKCADSGFENVCKARDRGLRDYLDCLEDNPKNCPFSVPFANGHFCECPLRVYLAKKLGK